MTQSDAESAVIETTEGGPFVLHGAGRTIRSAEAIESANGEPMTWSFGEANVTTDDSVSLCRCGQSSNKPYCDGSHADADWDASDQHAPEAPYAERARRIEAGDYTLLDDTKLCMHAGFCGTEKETVWQMLKGDPDSDVKGDVIRMVEKCPSGRITNVIDGDVVEEALPEAINVVPGGPLWVTGGLPVSNAAGEMMETRNRVTLCRCGASGNKPLCDGSHSDIDFDG